MSNIIAINQRYLQDPILHAVLPRTKDTVMLSVFSNLPCEATIPYFGLMPRAGINELPFCTDIIDLLGIGMPKYDPDFALSWQEVTDHRAHELEQMVTHSQQQLVVQWSGGIDSTCMLSAIIKNFSTHSKQQVQVACNWGSIIENPAFFENHIKGHFRTVDINNITRDLTHSHLVVGGEIADKISMTMGNLDQNLGVRSRDMFVLSWRHNKDYLIDYLSATTANSDFAVWFFELISNNIDSVDVPVETCFDFLWWSSFNFHWYGSILLEWIHHYRHTGVSWQAHQRQFVRWYETDSYQQWAMNNHAGSKYGTRLDSIKQQAKQYIFDLDHDEWYRKYKIKVSSAGRLSKAGTSRPFAMTDDFTLLDLDRDKETIITKLHTHLL